MVHVYQVYSTMVDGEGGGVDGAGVMLGADGADDIDGSMGEDPGGQTISGGRE